MLRWYGYVGLILILLVQINFFAKIEPFATWYIPIVWYGYILFIDSLVYRVRKRSLISSYPKEFLFMLIISVPFWLIFEVYNIFTLSWYYINYIWYVHLFDFTTIMPAILETFSLFTALELGKRFDIKKRFAERKKHDARSERFYRITIGIFVILGAILVFVPLISPAVGFSFMWFGLFLFIDPLNYLIGRPSIIQKVSTGKKSILIRLFLAGITMGFFWELWNYLAYPKWFYTFSSFASNIKLFEMPLAGYLGYLPFALEVFLFYALFRSFIFKKGNDMLDID